MWIALAWIACGNPVKQTLDEQRDRWAAQAPASYAYTMQFGCFCPDTYTTPVRITVADGAVTDAVYAEAGGDFVAGSPTAPGYPAKMTIDGLFDEAERAMREADDTHVEFDPDWGYPSVLQIDWQRNAADEEDSYAASDLVEG